MEERIEINPKILTGKPLIRGTRISVELILKLVAQRWTDKEIIDEYPSLTKDDIKAAIIYAERRKTIPEKTGCLYLLWRNRHN